VLALGRLVGIGVGTEVDRLAHIARRGELTVEQLREPGLVEDARLEVEPGAEVPVAVRGTGETVDAASWLCGIRLFISSFCSTDRAAGRRALFMNRLDGVCQG
jgi:hypothetical protein